jgi:hypothetical protein
MCKTSDNFNLSVPQRYAYHATRGCCGIQANKKWVEKAVVEWRRTHPLETLTKEHFAPVLKLAVDRTAKIEIIKNGFRACGLYE